MIIYMGDTTKGVLDGPLKINDRAYFCYYCGKLLKNIGHWSDELRANVCSPECEAIMTIMRGILVIGFDPIFLTPEELAFIRLP